MNRILVPSTDYYYDSDNEEQKPVNNPIHTKPINYPWHSFYNDKRKKYLLLNLEMYLNYLLKN